MRLIRTVFLLAFGALLGLGFAWSDLGIKERAKLFYETDPLWGGWTTPWLDKLQIRADKIGFGTGPFTVLGKSTSKDDRWWLPITHYYLEIREDGISTEVDKYFYDSVKVGDLVYCNRWDD